MAQVPLLSRLPIKSSPRAPDPCPRGRMGRGWAQRASIERLPASSAGSCCTRASAFERLSCAGAKTKDSVDDAARSPDVRPPLPVGAGSRRSMNTGSRQAPTSHRERQERRPGLAGGIVREDERRIGIALGYRRRSRSCARLWPRGSRRELSRPRSFGESSRSRPLRFRLRRAPVCSRRDVPRDHDERRSADLSDEFVLASLPLSRRPGHPVDG